MTGNGFLFIGLILGFWLTPKDGLAALQFEAKTITQEASPADTELTYHFKFTVTGDKAVTITDIRALCDCLKIRPDRNRYQPGEAGVIAATLQLGSYEGDIAKSFNVLTDNVTDGRILLRCVAQLPKIFDVSSQVVRWTMGEPAISKRVEIRIRGDMPVKLLSANATGSNMRVSVEEVEAGRYYEIVLTPASTAAQEIGMVTIDTDSVIPKFARRFLYFNIIPDRTQTR